MTKISPKFRFFGTLCLGIAIGVILPRFRQPLGQKIESLNHVSTRAVHDNSKTNHLIGSDQSFWETNIATTSLRQLAEHLAQIGCPKPTILAVIKCEIDRRYIGTVSILIRNALAAKLSNKNIDSSSEIDRIVRRKSIDLLDATGETLNSKIEQAILHAQLSDAYLGSDPKMSAAVQQVRERYRAILNSTDNLSPEDIARHLRNKDAEIMGHLPPEAARAYLLTETPDAIETRRTSKYLQLDEVKFAQLFDATKEFNDKIIEWQLADGHSISALPENYEELVKSKEASIQSILGEEEFAKFLRTSDPQFQMLDSWVESKGLPLDVSMAISEVREAVGAAYYKNVSEGSLQPAARAEYLQKLEDYSRHETLQILGKYNTELNTDLPIFSWISGITKGNIPTVPRRK